MRTVIYEQDGNQRCAHFSDFVNLQVSNAGFGDTDAEALKELFKAEPLGICQRPMWMGDGVPCWCHEPAYGPSDRQRYLDGKRDADDFRYLELACPRHGGPKP